MLIGLLTTALALFSVSTILVARDWVNWRDKTLSEMNIYAALIGANAAPSMIFGDYDAATEVLRTLKGNPNIVDAVLYDKDGKVFVRYRVQGHPDSAFPNLGAGSSLFDFGQLVVSKPVTLKGEVWDPYTWSPICTGFMPTSSATPCSPSSPRQGSSWWRCSCFPGCKGPSSIPSPACQT